MDILTLRNDVAPIPAVPTVAGWKELPIAGSAEPLVPLGLDAPQLSHRLIHSSSIYFGEHCPASPYVTWHTPTLNRQDLPGALITAFARSGVADALVAAQSHLPRGMRLVTCDTYRTLAVQGALYQYYYDRLETLHPGWDNAALSAETQRYVSLPSTDPARPSPHNTGGAIDTIAVWLPEAYWDEIDEIDARILSGAGDWKEHYAIQMYRAYLLNSVALPLPFGTRFDHGGEAAGLRYFEELAQQRPLTVPERRALVARRVLAQAMAAAGFQAYADEFWHFNLGNQMAAQVAGLPEAIYGGMELSPANREHEQMRVRHWTNLWYLSMGHRWVPPTGLEEHYRLVVDTVKALGSPRNAWTARPAEKISPVM